MNYISCESAAKKIGVSTRRIQQMCKQKEIVGAIKEGRNWLIPDNAILSPKKPLPIGVSDFKSATTNYYYVDKTFINVNLKMYSFDHLRMYNIDHINTCCSRW